MQNPQIPVANRGPRDISRSLFDSISSATSSISPLILQILNKVKITKRTYQRATLLSSMQFRPIKDALAFRLLIYFP